MAGGGPGAGPGPSMAGPPGAPPTPGGGGGGGGLPPELMKMALAANVAPQVFAQQNAQYDKDFLKRLQVLLRAFMRKQGLAPKAVGRVSSAITNLQAAANDIDKEKPQDAEPVMSLLAQGMQSKPMMSSSPPTMNRLPVTR